LVERRFLPCRADPVAAALVACWLHQEFGHPGGPDAAAIARMIAAPPDGPEESFLLLADGVPVGTASLAHDDLKARPDLTPWLAGVLVRPEHRGRGHAAALVRHVEGFARAAGVATLWLYTWSAEGLYAGLGWEREGPEQERGRPVVLMRRAL
jgi:GNAT superfamily N-acetyltransferase